MMSPKIFVEYDGILPDLFKEGQGIVAQGVLISPNTLRANEVLAKHDENYVPPDLKEKMESVHKPMGISKDDLEGNSEQDGSK